MQGSLEIKIGARWDDPVQNRRVVSASERGLIDYIEVNYPIPFDAAPGGLGVPVLAHTSINPTCSADGISLNIARQIKEGADAANSPWIGEHLSWLGTAPTGSLGYQINPLFTEEFKDITVLNVRRLRDYYARPVALELGPIYINATGYESEMHFLGAVAQDADTKIILDITHWQIGNRNLHRPQEYGLDAIDADRIVELHVAGMRVDSSGVWHDAHEVPPCDEVLALTNQLVNRLPAVQAVTFEHNAAASEEDFFCCLHDLHRAVRGSEARAA